jgi:hypothetical protein
MSNLYTQIRQQYLVNVTNPSMMGCTVIRKPVTKVLDSSTGDAIYTEGTEQNIDVYFTVFRTEEELYKEGNVQGANAYMTTRHTQAIKRDDIIIFDEMRFRVETVTPRYIQGFLVCNDCNLIRLGDN